MAARWRKQPNETGLRLVVQSPRGLELREDGEKVISVSPVIGANHAVIGWYWYGLGVNTYSTPCSSMDEAKAAATAHYKQWRANGCRH